MVYTEFIQKLHVLEFFDHVTDRDSSFIKAAENFSFTIFLIGALIWMASIKIRLSGRLFTSRDFDHHVTIMNVLEYTMNKNQSWITKSKTDSTSQTAVKKRSVVRITTLLEPPYASPIDGIPKKNNYNISELQGYWNPFKIEKTRIQ